MDLLFVVLGEGFDGIHCENNIDDCINHQCQNGGLCFDEIGSYMCICPPEFTGKLGVVL